MTKTLAIASDHAGFALKEILKQEAAKLGYEVLDLGTDSTESVDYPDYGYMVADSVASNRALVGVAICGSGIGISIAANRNPKVRAALCHNGESAKLARQHNDANVLVLGARMIDEKTAKECLREFLNTKFEGGRHQNRIDKLS
jgi:ribose 5-phosphate isomerase B